MEQVKRGMTILMVDDDPEDYLLLKDAFEECGMLNDIRLVSDGEELLNYIRQKGAYKGPPLPPTPSLILLDLNMPKKDGREVLREIKTDQGLRHIPIVVYTTSGENADILECYDMGASSFVTKPRTFEALLSIARGLGEYWFNLVQLPERSEPSGKPPLRQ